MFWILMDIWFYDEFLLGVEYLLKYEVDSILCVNFEDSLNDWLDWDFVGVLRRVDDYFVGNGGLLFWCVLIIKRVFSF